MERATFSELFYIKRSKLLKNGEAPIYLRITVNGKSGELSLKRSIDPSKWDMKKNKAKGRGENELEINEYIKSLKGLIYTHQKQLQEEGKKVTATAIINLLSGKKKEESDLLEYFEEHNERVKSLIGKEITQATVGKFETTKKHLEEYIQTKYKQKDIALEEIDHSFIVGFEQFLKAEKNCQHNSAMKYMKAFKKIINEVLAKEILRKNPFRNYKISIKATDREYLTMDELQKLFKKPFTIKRLEEVRDIYFFQCLTGLAYIDLNSLTQDNLGVGIDGNEWIRIRRGKTGNLCNIPLLPEALDIIEKYKGYDLQGKLLPVQSNQKMNAYLKEIADLCEIKKNLTTHMARHTYATTITLSNGVPIETVSKILGHKKLSTTQIYGRVLESKIAEDIKGLESKISF